MVDIGSTSGEAAMSAGRRGPDRPPSRSASASAPERKGAGAADNELLEDPHAAALAILAQQRRENPARFALGLTTALSRETDPLRLSSVRRRISEFASDLRQGEAKAGIVKGSALDQWLTAASATDAGPAFATRLRELTVPLGQAAIAADRAIGSKRATEVAHPRPVDAKETAAWLDPRRPEASKAEIVASASTLDEGGLRRLHAATVDAARRSPDGLAGELRRSGYQRAASELAEVARRRGLAIDHVESDRAKAKSKDRDKGR